MSNPSKAKGSLWERTLEEHFRGMFGNAERLTLSGSQDQGDLWFTWNGKTFVIEAKAEKSINLASYVTEAKVEAANWSAKRPLQPRALPVSIVKRRNHGVDKAYVVMELDQWVALVKT